MNPRPRYRSILVYGLAIRHRSTLRVLPKGANGFRIADLYAYKSTVYRSRIQYKGAISEAHCAAWQVSCSNAGASSSPGVARRLLTFLASPRKVTKRRRPLVRRSFGLPCAARPVGGSRRALSERPRSGRELRSRPTGRAAQGSPKDRRTRGRFFWLLFLAVQEK